MQKQTITKTITLEKSLLEDVISNTTVAKRAAKVSPKKKVIAKRQKVWAYKPKPKAAPCPFQAGLQAMAAAAAPVEEPVKKAKRKRKPKPYELAIGEHTPVRLAHICDGRDGCQSRTCTAPSHGEGEFIYYTWIVEADENGSWSEKSRKKGGRETFKKKRDIGTLMPNQ